MGVFHGRRRSWFDLHGVEQRGHVAPIATETSDWWHRFRSRMPQLRSVLPGPPLALLKRKRVHHSDGSGLRPVPVGQCPQNRIKHSIQTFANILAQES